MVNEGPVRASAPCAEFPNDNPALHGGAIWYGHGLLGAPRCELPEPVSSPITIEESLVAVEERPLMTEVTIEETRREYAAIEEHTPIEHLANVERVSAIEEDTGDEAGIEIVDELSFDSFVDFVDETVEHEGAPNRPNHGVSGDPFARFVRVLDDAAREFGADADSTACLHLLFDGAGTRRIAANERTTEALLTGGVLVRENDDLFLATRFQKQVLAWRSILRGESEEFGVSEAGTLEPLGPLDEWTADVVARVVGNPGRADGIRRELRRRGVAAFGLVEDAA